MQSTSCEIMGWMKHSWNPDCWEKYQQPQIGRCYHFNGRKQKELKSLLMTVKEKSEKVRLKFNIQKTKIMASGPITPWANKWGNSGNSDRLFFSAPKSLQMVTAVMKLKDIYSLEEKL